MFGVIKSLAAKAATIDQDKILKEILDDQVLEAKIIELNKNQMLAGIGSDGQALPRYVDDPFFKSIEAAERYAAWKEKISPNKSKDVEVMDFYITGQFHSTIEMKNEDTYFIMSSDSQIKDSVKSKAEALGLNQESISEITPEVRQKLINSVREKLK